jgi:hypothetical protein
MFVIDLSEIQPLDIVLTTCEESTALRAAQSMTRLQRAEFSHAAMFVAPTVLVESCDAGIVFEAFSNATPGDEFLVGDTIRTMYSDQPRTMRLNTRLLFERKSDRLRIFGGLPDATNVKVIRHKNVQAHRLREYRENLMKALQPFYLQDYPAFVDLMRTAPIPEALLSAFRQIAETIFGPVYNAGPFCSELVCRLLAESSFTFGARSATGTAPIDLALSGEFDTLDVVSQKSDSDDAPDIEKLFRFVPTPFLSPPSALAAAIAERVRYFKRTGSRRLDEVTYSKTSLGQQELETLNEWCQTVSDAFWNWYRNAPGCLASCSEKTQKRLANETSEIMRRLVQPCTNVYGCRSQVFGLDHVRDLIDAFDNKRIDEFLRTAPTP